MDKTLRELCETLNVTRRTIQGYEKAGLVTPSGRTNRGFLVYDENAQNRIQRIRLYQELGFSIKEIRFTIDAPKEVVKKNIGLKITELQNKILLMEEVVAKGYEILEQL